MEYYFQFGCKHLWTFPQVAMVTVPKCNNLVSSSPLQFKLGKLIYSICQEKTELSAQNNEWAVIY